MQSRIDCHHSSSIDWLLTVYVSARRGGICSYIRAAIAMCIRADRAMMHACQHIISQVHTYRVRIYCIMTYRINIFMTNGINGCNGCNDYQRLVRIVRLEWLFYMSKSKKRRYLSTCALIQRAADGSRTHGDTESYRFNKQKMAMIRNAIVLHFCGKPYIFQKSVYF